MSTYRIFTVDYLDKEVNVSYPDRRLGIVEFSYLVLTEPQHEDDLYLFFSQLIVLKTSYDPAVDTVRMMCLSKQFDPLPVGSLIPEYVGALKTDHQGVKSVEFSKRGSVHYMNATSAWPWPSAGQSAQSAGDNVTGADPNTTISIDPNDPINIDLGVLDLDLGDTSPAPNRKTFDSIKDMIK